jgi:dTDP-glucose pyrophosphorylase
MSANVIVLGASMVDPNDDTPVFLLERSGELFVEKLIKKLSAVGENIVFALQKDAIKNFHLDNIIFQASSSAKVVPVPSKTAGAACTGLLCVEHIALDQELLILSGNEYLDFSYEDVIRHFREQDVDAGVVVFASLHPRYSYVRVNSEDLVVEAAEKNPISRLASAGFVWFRKGALFVSSAKNMIRKDSHLNNVFYVSLALNELVLAQKRIGIFKIDTSHYCPLKSKRQISSYEDFGGDE